MELDSQPTVSEALNAVRALEKIWRLYGWMAFFVFVGCIIMAFFVPWILIALLPSLIGISIYQDRLCEPQKIILNTFARNRNWFFEPAEVLRHVAGYGRRKRFYAEPNLISIASIIERIKAGDFASHPAPPKGEVPRKSPVRGNSSFGGGKREKVAGWAGTPSRNATEPLTALVEERNRRLEEAMQHAEEEKRHIEMARQRAEEEKRRAEETKQRAEEEIRRNEEAKRRVNEEKRRIEEAQQRADEEARRLEEARRRAEEEKRHAEEVQRRLEEPRFRLYLDETWTDLMSVKKIWRLMEEGKVRLTNYGMEKGSTDSKQLDQFPDFAALFMKLIVANKEVLRKQHSRDRKEKEECVKFHGTKCAICGFSFEHEFGKIGEGYIEVHHLKPVANDSQSDYRIVNPVADLRPVCANCHRMLHTKNPPYSIAEMIQIRSMRSV